MRRAALAAPIVGVLGGGFGGTAALAPAAQPCAAASYSSHVTLVVEHGDDRVVGLCIGFDGSSITGEQIVQASGLENAMQSYGSLGDAVCQLDGEPASYGACLPASGSYWAMFVSRGGGAWQNADRGISTETFGDGDAEGFRYESQSGPEPPPASPAGICARALATPTPVATSAAAAAGAPPRAAASAPGPTLRVEAGSTSAARSASASPVSSAVVPASAAPSVISPARSSGTIANSATSARAPTGPDAALLAAGAAGVGLSGLALTRLLRRRRVGRT